MTDYKNHIDHAAKRYDLLAIGGSAGSFPAMLNWVSYNQGPPIALVIHRSKEHKSNLTNLLQHYTNFIVKEPKDGEPLQPDHVYIAPPGFHMILDEENCWRLLDTAPVWHCKPAIDVLFASLGANAKLTIASVLLSGANEDGGIGLKQIKSAGGLTLCMNPETAEYANMPNAAKKQNGVVRYFNLEDIKGLCAQYFNP